MPIVQHSNPSLKVSAAFLMILISLSLSGHLFAQSFAIDHELIGSAGSTYQIENTCLSFSVGESVINTLQTIGQPAFTQGFQQPILKDRIVNVSSYQSTPDWDISLYPNPTTDLIKLQINAKNQTDFQVEVLDYLGRFVFSKEISAFSEVSTLDCRSLASGTYWLRVLSKDRSSMITRSFQLVR